MINVHIIVNILLNISQGNFKGFRVGNIDRNQDEYNNFIVIGTSILLCCNII